MVYCTISLGAFDMSEDWKTYLTPHLTYVVQNLQPLLVLDRLREKQLLACEECTQLHNVRRQATDQDCCRQLLDILFKKGPDSFKRFLEVLRSTPGQEHIANKMKPMDTSSSSFRGKSSCMCTLSVYTHTHTHTHTHTS